MGVSSPRRYSAEDVREAAGHFATHGDIMRTSRATGIPDTTLHEWIKNPKSRHRAVWDEAVATVREENAERWKGRYSVILDAALDRTLEALPEASAAAASTVAGIAFDKLRIMANQPTRITESRGGLEALAEQFVKLANSSRTVATSHRIVEGEAAGNEIEPD